MNLEFEHCFGLALKAVLGSSSYKVTLQEPDYEAEEWPEHTVYHFCIYNKINHALTALT